MARRRRNGELVDVRRVPGPILKLVRQLKRRGAKKVLLVGGAVIDMIQGRAPKDWDLEVYGLTYSKLERLLRLLGYRPNMVGRSFGIIKVPIEGLDVDLNIPRTENRVGVGHRDFDIQMDPNMSVKEAARRRDFTINAMALDIETGQLYNPFGGLEDLRAGVLRMTDPEKFVEDPLRALRGMQLLARKAKRVDPATMRVIRSLSPAFPTLSKERVFEEFNKLLLKAPKPSIGLEYLRKSGWIRWFPELEAQIGVPQRHEWHAEGDVWTHMLLTVNQAARIRHCLPEHTKPSQNDRLAYMYAAMLHDVGKPAKTRLERDPPELYLTAHGHDAAGRKPAKSFLKRLTNDNAFIERVESLVGEHMQPYNLAQAFAEQRKAAAEEGDGRFVGFPAYVRLAKRLRSQGASLGLLGRVSQADKAGSLRPGEPHRYLDPETCAPSWEHEPSDLLTEAYGRIEKTGVLKAKKVQGRDLEAHGYDGQKLARRGIYLKPALDAAFQAQMDHPDWPKKRLLRIALDVMEKQVKAKSNRGFRRRVRRSVATRTNPMGNTYFELKLEYNLDGEQYEAKLDGTVDDPSQVPAQTRAAMEMVGFTNITITPKGKNLWAVRGENQGVFMYGNLSARPRRKIMSWFGRPNPMTKKEANAKMRAKYRGRDWWDVPGAMAERDALMRGAAPSKPKPAARPKPRSKPAAAAPKPKPTPRPRREAPATPARRSSRDPGPPSGVMLAKKWKGSDPTGWWMSEKLDGMRAYWTGHEFYTRNGNLIAAPDWFKAVMPQGVALDGEIYMGRGRFQEVMSVARKATPRDPRWNKVCFMAFDAPEVPGGCEARFRALEGFVDDACRRWRGKGRCPLVFVEQRRCASRGELDRFHREVEKLRGEGVMLRAPGSRYARSRTSDLLKVKSFIDTEARITGYTAGTGKHKGRLGAYKAKLLSSGVEFKIGTGISDRERDRPLPRGTVVTVRFQEYTNAGVPRFPSLVGARDYE